MGLQKGQFVISFGTAEIDLAELSRDEWNDIQDIANKIIREDNKIPILHAYCGAFLSYVDEISQYHEAIEAKYCQQIH